MEEKFSTEGLQAAGEDDDLLMAMARELVTEQRIGESAEMLWRDIQAQNAAIVHGDASPVEPVFSAEIISDLELQESAPRPLPAVADQLLLFNASLAGTSKRKRAPGRRSSRLAAGRNQLVLF